MAMARFEAEKFSGKNDFGLWRIKMHAMLIQHGLAEALEMDPKRKLEDDPDEKGRARKKEIMEKARSALILSLSDKVLREVSKETTAAGIWQKLESLYLTKSLANRLYMKQKLYSYKFYEERGISEQLDEFNKAVDDLENIDVKLDDEDKAIILLNALPRSFEHLKDAMLYGRETTITLEEVQCALRSKELQRASNGKQESGSQALSINKFKGKKMAKDLGKKPGAVKGKDVAGKETRSCHYCKKPGHLKRDCYSWKRKQNEENQTHDTTDLTQEVEVAEALNVSEQRIETSWILDSGCTFHICSHKDWFEDLEPAQGSVLLGNDQICDIKGIGNIRLQMHDKSHKLLTKVRYIPTIKRNLVSLGMLETKGYTFTSKNGQMMVLDGSRLIMKGERRNSLYYLLAKTILGASHSVEKPSVDLWHKRLAHVSERGLLELMKKGVITAGNLEQTDKCEECILGKSKKLPYKTGVHSSKHPLDYAHCDLWGPCQTETIGGGRYFMSIIDDYTRKLWVFVLKEKSQAFTKFKEWVIEMKQEKGSILKCLRTDNGLEFLSNEFELFCREQGIKRHLTVPRNPQQNGVAERMNRTLLERVRCMIFTSGVPKRFWGEAVSTAAVLINRCPSSAIDNDIPDMRWYGNLGDYSMIKVFGCAAYAHSRKGKLDPRAQKCIFLGYQKHVKGYRLWSLEEGNQKIVVSRDVVFKEEYMPYLDRKVNSSQNSSSDKIEFFNKESGPASDSSDLDDAVIEGGFSGGGAGPSSNQEHEAQTSQRNEEAEGYMLARDRSRREVKLPSKYNDYDMTCFALCVAEMLEYSEPLTYEEAMRSKEKHKWIQAMKEEIESLLKNKTWILVDNPGKQKLIGCKWIFKRKIEVGAINKIRYKARLVAKGFTQKEGIDFNEIFSPVVKHSSIRVLLALAAHFDWELQQLDVKTAFLHGDLEETIYMVQPEGFTVPGSERKVCLLKKSLYGLRQSSRQWYIKFDEHMMSIGFRKSDYDACVYIKERDSVAVAYLLLYVDDMLLAGPEKAEIQKVKMDLQSKFEVKDLGDARRILGMDIARDRSKKELRLYQTDYIRKVLEKFQMKESRDASVPLAAHFKLSATQSPQNEQEWSEMKMVPYANIIGSVMYMMICTRPDIAHEISVTSRYMSNYGKDHWHALKWTLRYLKGSSNLGIIYGGNSSQGGELLQGFCDADYATNLDSRKSQNGYVFNLWGAAVSWKSNLQSVVALSTTEAEYIALTEAVKEAKWLQGVLGDFGIDQKTVTISCDSNSALHLAKHQVFHERSKHIDVKLHFIRDEIQNGKVKVVKVSTDHNAADMLTKALPMSKFKYCLELVNVVPC